MAIFYLDDHSEAALEIGDKRFYRYYSLKNAELSLSNYSFWFSNPTKWEDPFEKLFIDAKYVRNGKYLDFPLKDKLYCLCITNEDNSLASWKAYSDNQIAIRFEINSKEFINLLDSQHKYDIYIGKVQYKATKKINGKNGPLGYELRDLFDINIPIENKLRLLLLKRYAFRYENEYRVIIVSKSKGCNLDGINISFSKNIVQNLIPEIKIGPSTDFNMVQELKDKFRSFGIIKVSQSKLNSPFKPREYKL